MEGIRLAARPLPPLPVHGRLVPRPESDRRVRRGQRGEAESRVGEIRPGAGFPDVTERRVPVVEGLDWRWETGL